MSTFTSAPYSLSIGTLIVATVEGLNVIGYSTPSPQNTVGASVQTIPTGSVTPTNGAATTNT
jgi:hypothetical protein